MDPEKQPHDTGREAADEPRLTLSDFDYVLPPVRIASEPVRPRDRSRLLVVNRKQHRWTDSAFSDLAQHLDPSDIVVLNNTRVLKARLFGTLERTGRKIEILFTSPISAHCWQALLRPGRRARRGDRIAVETGEAFTVEKSGDDALWQLTLVGPGARPITNLLEAVGHVPLPPYLRRDDRPADLTDYQTIYSSQPGAIAAPTAGLHFSEKVFTSLQERGIETVELTLHVGAGTFLPVRTEDPTQHQLTPESYAISNETAIVLNRGRRDHRRIVAVGTTTTRTLEYVFHRHGHFAAGTGETDLFITPGFRFAAVDGLLTNFHLPRSTLLLLVSAFASRELVLKAYQHAIDKEYRFYSYGDCALFL